MKTRSALLLITAFAGVFAFSGCKKEKTSAPVDETVTPVKPAWSHAGLGDYSGVPSGTYIFLPGNISVVGLIRGGIQKGNATFIKGKPGSAPYLVYEDKANYLPVGTGTYVNLFMTFRNSSPEPSHFVLPAGLIFCDDTTGVGDTTYIPQHGFLLKDAPIDVPGNSDASFEVKSYCVNAHGSPGNFNVVYNFGPVTNFPGLVEIVNILKPKQQPVGHEGEIQGIIWNVTNGNGLTEQDRATLNALP